MHARVYSSRIQSIHLGERPLASSSTRANVGARDALDRLSREPRVRLRPRARSLGARARRARLLEEIFRARFGVRDDVRVSERRFVRQPRDRRLDLARVDEDVGRRRARRRVGVVGGGHSRARGERREVMRRGKKRRQSITSTRSALARARRRRAARCRPRADGDARLRSSRARLSARAR